jgi:hypothetical protein
VSPATNSFEFRKGEDAEIDFTQRTGESDTDPVEDITGWTFSFKVKRTSADADPSVVTPTISIVTAAAGTYKVVISAADLALMDGDYVYSCWRTNSGAKACLSEGFFSVVDTPES